MGVFRWMPCLLGIGGHQACLSGVDLVLGRNGSQLQLAVEAVLAASEEGHDVLVLLWPQPRA